MFRNKYRHIDWLCCYLVFFGEATGVLMTVFGEGINVCGLVDLELLFDVHLIPVYGPIIIK